MRDDRDMAAWRASAGQGDDRRRLLWLVILSSLASWAIIGCLVIDAADAIVRQVPPLLLWLGGQW